MTNQISLNVRFLLWKKGVPSSEWVAWLETRSDLGLYPVRAVVAGTRTDDQVTGHELRELSRVFELGDEGDAALRFEDFPATRAHILTENLRHLIGGLPHGGKKELAGRIGVDPATISRWLSGAYEPEGPSLNSLLSAFHLRSGTDLKREPLFLSVEPVSATEQRRWLLDRLAQLDPVDVQDLYPALKRMLEER